MQETFQLARERLAVITAIVGEVVGGGIAIVFYFTFFVIFALIAKLGDNPLRPHVEGPNFWVQREPVPTDLQKAQRQG